MSANHGIERISSVGRTVFDPDLHITEHTEYRFKRTLKYNVLLVWVCNPHDHSEFRYWYYEADLDKWYVLSPNGYHNTLRTVIDWPDLSPMELTAMFELMVCLITQHRPI